MNKIKNKKGITIIHALVSVLIFGVFASIMFTATSTNLKSIAAQKEYQQAYLTVSSAAELFLDSIDGDAFEITKRIGIKDGTKDQSEITQWNYADVSLTNPLKDDDVFKDLIQRAYTQFPVYTANPHTIQTKIDGITTEVVMDVQVGTDCTLYVNFYIKQEETNNNNYYMCIELAPDDSWSAMSKVVNDNAGACKINNVSYTSSVIETFYIKYFASNAVIKKGRYEHAQS